MDDRAAGPEARGLAGGQSLHACDFLRIRAERGSVYTYATIYHRCFFGGYRLRPTIEQQEEFCLPGRTAECPIAARLDVRAPDDVAERGYASGRTGLRGRWSRLVGKG